MEVLRGKGLPWIGVQIRAPEPRRAISSALSGILRSATANNKKGLGSASKDLHSKPSSPTDELCDHGQVTPLCFVVW